jgi:DegV family protein with EDD domain
MITIVTDTTAGLPRELTLQLNIPVLPQIVIFGEKSFRDDTELDTATFLDLLKSSPILPKTSAPPPPLYFPIFEKASKTGDTVICLHPSSKVSGTIRSAQVASQDFPNTDICIVDTQTIACNLGTLVLLASEWVKENMDRNKLLSRLDDLISRQRIYFLVDTLEYLHRGGRIGGAKALIGEMLQVKPILTMKNGQVEPFEQQRTKRRALARLVEITLDECAPNMNSHLCVMHADALQEAENLAGNLKDLLKLDEIPIYEVPPAIVVHAGPKILGVGFFTQS